MSEQVGSVTCKKSSDFHGRIRFQSRFTIRWELEDKNVLKVDIICLDDSVHVKYRIVAIKTNENFITFSNSVTFRKPRGTDLVTRGRLARSKARQGDSLRHQIPIPCPQSPPPHGIYIDRCISAKRETSWRHNHVYILSCNSSRPIRARVLYILVIL